MYKVLFYENLINFLLKTRKISANWDKKNKLNLKGNNLTNPNSIGRLFFRLLSISCFLLLIFQKTRLVILCSQVTILIKKTKKKH